MKKRARQVYGTHIGFAGRGEMLPNPTPTANRSDVRLSVGHPRFALPLQWSDLRVAPGQDMQETFRAIVETMGGEFRTKTSIHGQYPSD